MRRPIRIFRIGPCEFTPFGRGDQAAEQLFREHGTVYTDNPLACDLFVTGGDIPRNWRSKSRQALLLLRYQFRRRILVWTDEPWTLENRSTVRWSAFQPEAHFMTAYTGDVHIGHFGVFGWAIHGPLAHKTLAECPEPGRARCVGVVGYVAAPKPRYVGGMNVDQNAYRMAVLQEGHRRGRFDIYGPNWPAGMSKEDSRTGEWWRRKIELLRGYDVGLAMENTAIPYYCSEKIWTTLEGGCLPIYSRFNNRIDEIFPKDSFIDAAGFPNPADLIAYIDRMPAEEYCARYNRCIDANNRVFESLDYPAEREAVLAKLAGRIETMAGR